MRVEVPDKRPAYMISQPALWVFGPRRIRRQTGGQIISGECLRGDARERVK